VPLGHHYFNELSNSFTIEEFEYVGISAVFIVLHLEHLHSILVLCHIFTLESDVPGLS